jgi:hypothetical protein
LSKFLRDRGHITRRDFVDPGIAIGWTSPRELGLRRILRGVSSVRTPLTGIAIIRQSNVITTARPKRVGNITVSIATRIKRLSGNAIT